MNKQNGVSLMTVLLIIAIIGVISILGALLYMRFTKIAFDFQIVLPKESVFNLDDMEDLDVTVEVDSTVWFDDSEEVEISLIKSGKYEFADSFLSKSKPFGLINVIGSQKGEDGSDLYLGLSAYVFYRPFIEENLTKEEQNILSFCLWEEKDSFLVDARSTAVAYLINNYLVFSMTNSSENPFSFSLPSSEDLLSDLPGFLSHPRFPELQSEISNLLSTGAELTGLLWFEGEAAEIISEIIDAPEFHTPTEEDVAVLPQTKDAEIKFQLGELWKIAVESDNLDTFNATAANIRPIVNKIAQNGGELIIHNSSSSVFDFCAYSILNQKRDGLTLWRCIDDSGAKCDMATNPSAHCNQSSFACSCNF